MYRLGLTATGRMVTYYESIDRDGGNGTCIETSDITGCSITSNM